MAPRIAEEIWEQYRDEIIALYCAPKPEGTLKKTMQTMKEKHGFQATYWWLSIIYVILQTNCPAVRASILRNLRLGVYRNTPTAPSGPMRTRKRGNESWRKTRILGWSSTEERGHRRKSKEKSPEMSHIQVACSCYKTFLHLKAFKRSLREPRYLLHLSLSEKCARATFQVFSYIRWFTSLCVKIPKFTSSTLFQQ